MRGLLFFGLMLAVGCAPVVSPAPAQALADPLPYQTLTPSATAAPTGLAQFAETPLPSPTPFDYAVKAGDTLGGIANHFNVAVDALMAANPGVSPNAMSVGQTLKIPSTPRNITGEGTPTPAPFAIGQVACYSTADGGLWCFALARNDSAEPMENLTAQITLMDAEGQPAGSQMALLPLDILPAYTSLPLSVYFAPPVSADARPEVQVLTAIRLNADDPRYLPARVQNTTVLVNASGLSARASGQVALPANAKAAASVWVAAVAYDGDGRVVGVRRWESGSALQPGSSLPFSMMLGSVAGAIERVDFAVQARP